MKIEDCKEGMKVKWSYLGIEQEGIIYKLNDSIFSSEVGDVLVKFPSLKYPTPCQSKNLTAIDSEFEINAIRHKYDAPSDYSDPDWSNTSKVHDWKNYIIEELQNCWESFNPKQRLLIATNAQKIADNEEWE